MTEQASTELALPTITPEQYPALYVSGGLDPYYQQIRNQVLSEVPDLNTKAGIARVKSLARIVSESKTAIEKPGRNYLKQLKEMPKVIEAELRDWVTKMDALRDEVRQPVTELEEKEKARIAALDQRLNEIHQIGSVAGLDILPSETITAWIGKLEAISVDATWDEYQDRAALAKEAAKVKLESALHNRMTWEAQQAEIARLKAERDEQDRIQREARIKEEAKLEAERESMRKQIELERQKREAEEAQAKAEQSAKDAKLKAEQDAKDAQQQLEQERKDAEERQRLAVQQAADQERQRQIDEQNRIAQEEEQRKEEAAAKAANIEHQKLINNEILDDMQAAAAAKGFQLSREMAVAILSGMVFGKVRHTQVQY